MANSVVKITIERQPQGDRVEGDLQDIIDAAKCVALRRRLERFQNALADLLSSLAGLADEFEKEKIFETFTVGRLRSRFDEVCVRFDSVLSPLGLDVANQQTLRNRVFQQIDIVQEAVWDLLPSMPILDPSANWESNIQAAGSSLTNAVENIREVQNELELVSIRKRATSKTIHDDVEYLLTHF